MEKILARIESLEERVKKIEDSLLDNPEKKITQKQLSTKEFILSLNLSDEIEKTLAICYFLEVYGKVEKFNVKDIEKGFEKTKEPKPKNTNYKVFKNVEKGHLMELDEKKDNLKAYSLTNTGLQYVENNLSDKKND